MLIRAVAIGGHDLLMFCKATWRLRALKALLASTKSAASLESKAVLTACTAASIPEICPPHNWRHPEASWTSDLTTDSTALAMIRRAVSPMPMGRTPGLLSRAMRRQASRGEIDFGSTSEVQILLAVDASALHRSADAPLKEVHSLLQSCASRPDGPADPEILIVAERMALASIDSKITGCTSEGAEGRIQSALALWPVGCLLISTSLTVGEPGVFGSEGSSR